MHNIFILKNFSLFIRVDILLLLEERCSIFAVNMEALTSYCSDLFTRGSQSIIE